MKKNTAIAIIAALALVTIVFCALFFSKSSQLNSLSAEKDAQLEALENEKNEEISALESAGKEKDQKIESLTAETKSKTETIEALTAETQEKAGIIDTLTSENDDYGKQISSLTSDVKSRDEQIDSLNSVIEEKNTEAEKLSSELAEKIKLVEEFKSDAAEKDEAIRTLTTETVELTATIASLEEEIDEKDDQISSYKEIISDLQSQIDAIYSSSYVIPRVTAEPTNVSDFIYVNNGTEVQINGYQGYGGQVVIPDYIDGKPVTRIADHAFYKQDSITGIVLPTTLKTIGDTAFGYLKNLSGIIVIPENVTSVGGHSFQSTSITGLVIKSNCTLDINAFANNSSLEFIYIADGSTVKIDTAVFSYADNLTTCVIPNETSEIKDETFKACNSLVFYTPAGSAAETYARKNFIQVNTADYEAQNAFFKNVF